ncbi:MAG: electron transfer flavoprotein subunit beta/FixA family protein [Candidatus Methanoplasma sp.]|jgi:electron transfer flavoprotein beta subunit|nr:electron transfer flavoprotein subunit beta/FixA family protein [Candidatus Methanoplasma sp.]
MRYVVFIKQVPDTSMISTDENGNLLRTGVPSILNPYCELAMDVASRLKKDGDIITAVTMGPPQAKEALFRTIELGADEAYLLSDRSFAGADVHATVAALTAFVGKYAQDYDLILCGKQAADGDTAEVPAETAEVLGVQQFCYAENISIEGDSFVIEQNYGDEMRTVRAPKGSVVSVSKGDVNRRLPSITDYLRATEVEIKTLDRSAIGIEPGYVGSKGSKTHIVSSKASGVERRGRVVDGTDPKKAAEHIIREVVK